MAYGSWSGGIFVLQIDKTTGKAIYPGKEGTSTGSHFTDRYFGTKIAGGYGKSGEGPFIVYDKDTGYYYLYVTYGGLNATGGYNMRMFRSIKPDGPYVDASGKNAVLPSSTDNSPYGIKLMGNYKFSSISSGYRSPGHNSSFIDSDGQMYLRYHTRFDNGTEYHEVRVHQMFINKTGGQSSHLMNIMAIRFLQRVTGWMRLRVRMNLLIMALPIAVLQCSAL